MKRQLFKQIVLGCGLLGCTYFANATKHTIIVADFSFTPTTLTAHVGDTVQWVWASGMHTTTSQGIPSFAASWDSPIDNANPSFSYKLTHSGNYLYGCTIHPNMVATLSVLAATGINSIANAPFTLAPNPANNVLQMNGQVNSMEISAYDITGKLVKNLKLSHNTGTQKTFDVGELQNGYYILRVVADGASYMDKLMIAH